MLDALIAGRLVSTPEKRVATNGSPFAKVRVSVATNDGARALVNVVAFDVQPMTALLMMADGEGISATGPMTMRAWVDDEGQARCAATLVAQNILSAYSVTKKRQVAPPTEDTPNRNRPLREQDQNGLF